MTGDPSRRRLLTGLGGGVLLAALTQAGCADVSAGRGGPVSAATGRAAHGSVVLASGGRSGGAIDAVTVIDRITWGANDSTLRSVAEQGLGVYLGQQLSVVPAPLPEPIQAQIDAMSITRTPVEQLVVDLEKQRLEAQAQPDDAAKAAGLQAYQQSLNRLAREASTRFVLRAVYSPGQLHQQMTWFWLNHFSVFQGKANLRALVGDFEERAIRPHAFGRFRDLVLATVKHPAMLRYLDNEQNALNRRNENYARELLELHTLGLDAGYSQRDVQEMARILTGIGVANLSADPPKVRAVLAGFYRREGLFEFNPNRHDFNDKVLLGRMIVTQGMPEIEDAVDRLCRHPATSRFISRKLASFFLGADPSTALVDRLSWKFREGDGDIAFVLQALFESPEFVASLTQGVFKDPLHYVISALRLSYDQRPILNAGPALGWLSRMGQPLFGRTTPDGYPMEEAAWSSPGQMVTRFEIAKAIGSGNAGLFRADVVAGGEALPPGMTPTVTVASPVAPALPKLVDTVSYRAIEHHLGEATRQALKQANSPQEWNTLLLASPEMMRR